VTVLGTVSEEGCRVTVGGIPAEVQEKQFEANLPRTGGVVEVVAVARDAAGNEARARQRVCAYQRTTLVAFLLLLKQADWREADPPRNVQGLLSAVHEPTGLTFVLLPAGSFRMGSPPGEEGREETEGPQHLVTVPAFLMCRTECTRLAWSKASGGALSRRGADRPIENIDWLAAKNWCRKMGLRLPSEAEWEYACRAGSTGSWCFGGNRLQLARYAWYRRNSGGTTHPVATRLPNDWGLFDMHGNVYEWCEDIFLRTYAGAPTDGRAMASTEPLPRVARGGGWLSPASLCRSAMRRMHEWRPGEPHLGFRPARSLPSWD
jgi:formylglycine-generating enzyme required for sulfatase activity